MNNPLRVFACILIHSLLLAALLGQEEGEPRHVPATDPAVAIMGRGAAADGAVQMGFPGVTVRFSYRGPAPALRMVGLSADCYFDVSIDGGEPVAMRLKEGENEVALPFPEGGPAGSVVEIVRRTESRMGEAVFLGLALPEGSELLTPPAWPSRRLLFIGDSSACGAFNERFPPQEELTPRASNAARSYAMLLAERYDAQAHLVAYSGQGIARDEEGKAEGADVRLAPESFELATPALRDVYWDHSTYVPEVIVINLGADFHAGLLDPVDYVEQYQAFVMRVRVLYPLSYIVLAESSYFSEQSGEEGYQAREQLRVTLEAVVARGREAGDERIVMTPARYYPGTPGHPQLTAHQHRLLADEIGSVIERITGWRRR